MKRLVYISLLITTLTALSCSEDLLDKPPLDRIGNESFWKTSGDLENYVIQFYTIFPDYGDGGYPGIYTSDASNSDNMITASPSTVMNGTRAIPERGNGWSWTTIRNVNIFFDNYHKCEAEFDEYKNSLGEAHFFKAYLYFGKVSTFGDVPWYTHTLQTDSKELYAKRTPRTQVMDSILWHLDKAIEYLDPLKDAGSNRLSKEAALVYKSRVALFEGSWQKYHKGTDFATSGADPAKYFKVAVDAAEELIDGDHKVGIYNTGNPDADYTKVFNQDDMSGIGDEIILWKRYDRELGLAHESQRFLTVATDQRSVNFSLIESYLDKNGQPYDYRTVGKTVKGNAFLTKIAEDCDPRLKQVVWIPGQLVMDNKDNGTKAYEKPPIDASGEYMVSTGFQVKKGANPESPGAGAVFGKYSETGSIVFRYAEALLNYAEAKYELDKNVDYNKSLNVLRKRAGMPLFDANLTDPYRVNHSDYGYAIDNELHEIRRERRIELACEGFRAMDWRRWRAHALFFGKRPQGYPFDASEWGDQTIAIPVGDDGLLDPFQSSLGDDGYKFKIGRDYLNAIPTQQTTLNPNLKPNNPGWE